MTSYRKSYVSQIFDFLSGEKLLTWFANQRNSGGVIFARAVWVCIWVAVALEIIRRICLAHENLAKPDANIAFPQTLSIAASAIRRELGHITRQYGPLLLAILAGTYTALYTRFSSQWQYLADLYNQIKAKEIDISLARDCNQLKELRISAAAPHNLDQEMMYCNPAVLLAQWKTGFIEDALSLHLAEKPLFATVISNWRQDPVVAAVVAHSKRDALRSPTRSWTLQRFFRPICNLSVSASRMKKLLILSLLANLIFGAIVIRLLWPDASGTTFGSFVNPPPKTSLDDNGRDITLLEDFAYKDRRNVIWVAPKGYVSNGASIPSFLWSLVGGPLDGKYRNAALIHDAACDAMEKPPADVHLAFYEACRCGGLSEVHAKILYTGVLLGGPRWSLVTRQESVLKTVTKYVSEERTREFTDARTGEKKTVTYTVQVPVSEQVSQTVARMIPEREPGLAVYSDTVSELVQFIGDGSPSLADIRSWAEDHRESRDAAGGDTPSPPVPP